MADTRELVNGYDAQVTAFAEAIPEAVPVNGISPTRAIVNGYDAEVVTDASGGGGTTNVSINTLAEGDGAGNVIDSNIVFSVANDRWEAGSDFYAPALISDVSSIYLDEAIKISSGGENVTFSDIIDNDNFNPVWIPQGIGTKPFARLTNDTAEEITYEASKVDILINPTWPVTILTDHRSIKYTFETDTTITNCRFEAFKNGILFYGSNIGTLTADVETEIDLTILPNVPVDIITGASYDLNVTSTDGDVRLKGSIANNSPFFKATLLNFVDAESITEQTYATESISTSAINGGDITEASPTTINISAGTGRIVSLDDITGVATVTQVSWPDNNNIALPDILTRESTRIGVDSTGGIVQVPFVLTDTFIRDYIILGFITHPDGIIVKIKDDKLTSRELYSQLVDHLEVLGVTRKKGVSIGAGTGLTLTKTAGLLESPGGGISSGENGQNLVVIDAASPASFTTFLGTTNTIVLTGTTAIDPGFYDSGTGTKTAMPIGITTASIINIYQSIDDSATGLFYKYGETVYASLDEAILNAPTDVASLAPELETRANLVARIAIRRDVTDLQVDVDKYEILSGVKFGAGLDGQSLGTVSGGGDYFGPAASITDELHTFIDTSGKSGKSGSNITAIAGHLRGVIGTDLYSEDSRFLPGDTITYPVADGLAGDSLKTDGAGGLTLEPSNYVSTSVDVTLGYNDKLIYVSALANEVTLTMGDNPRQGERKRIWIADNTFPINILSANPAFPVSPPPTVAEGNVQGLWTLGSDLLDRYNPTSRDLTLSGVGGGFVPITVNGEVVDAFDFAKNSYAVATTSAYKGVLGSSTMCISTWYQANAGQPTTLEILCGWGSGLAPNGSTFSLEMQAVNGIRINFRSIWRQWTYASLAAANLYDGNAHNIQMIKTGAAASTVSLYIDGVFYPHTSQDNFPTPAIVSGEDFRIGSQFNGGNPVNAKLYDFRLYNRALTLTELDQIRLETLTGGAVITASEKDMVFDMSYNGVEWALGVGTESLAITNKSRLDAVEANYLKGTGSSSTDQLVTYADETGLQASNAAGVTIIGGVFNRIAPDTSISLEANTGGFVLLISPDGFVGIEPGGAFLSYGSADIAVRPTGAIECTSITGGFFPPSMTTAQRLAIPLTEGSHVRDTDLGLSMIVVGGLWQSYGALTVAGRTAEQSGIPLVGTLQPITTGTFHYYQIAGVDSTPTLAGGLWTVDVTGKYQLNLSGWPVSGGAVESQVIFYVSVNGSDYLANPNVGIAAVGINGDGIAMGGQIDLSAGDNVNIAYSVISGTGWTLDRFHWDIARLS